MGLTHFNIPELTETRKKLRNSATKTEKIMWEYLRGSKFLGLKFRRQHSIGRYILDFYCPSIKLGIEIDGEIHNTLDAKEYDKIRTEYVSSDRIRICRFTNDDVLYNIEKVLKDLENYIYKIIYNTFAPLPIREGLGVGNLGKQKL